MEANGVDVKLTFEAGTILVYNYQLTYPDTTIALTSFNSTHSMNTEDILTAGDKEEILKGWSESVKNQLAEGIHKDEIIKQITDTGLEHDAAAEFVEKYDQTIKDPFSEQKAIAKEYSDKAGSGGWWILGSILLGNIGHLADVTLTSARVGMMDSVEKALAVLSSGLIVIAFLWGFFKFVTNIARYYQVKRKIPKPSKL